MEFVTHQNDSRFYERITTINYKLYPMGYPMDEGEIIFYDASGDIVKRWKFADTIIKSVQNVFYTDGEIPMMTYLVLSPAIQNYGHLHLKTWNISYVKPEPYKTPVIAHKKEETFQLKIKHLADKKTFVPLGIPAFSGTPENKNIEFEIEIIENDIDDFQVDFLHDDKVIQTYFSGSQTLDEVVVTAKGSGNTSNSNTSNSQSSPSNYPKGKYSVKWDGFDSNGIYDSTIFTTGKLKARIKGKRNGKEKTAESSEFAFDYKEVKWVDTKIDKNAKRIDITLRVNLKDGGENGTEKDCYELGKARRAPIVKICPWDKITKKDLTYGTPIKTRTKSFADLEKLAIDGLNYHWSRNQNHFIAKDVDINGEKYELYVNAINTKEKTMDDVSLIFNTNKSWMRSGNPGTVEDPISFIGNIVSREAICYNIGYIYEYFYKDNWDYQTENLENLEFKFTAAHEIGHTILKAYGGTFYSYGHKGSVNTITQKMKTIAPEYPKSGEIDIMPYYPSSPPPTVYNRYVASYKDVLGLLWLTKIEMK